MGATAHVGPDDKRQRLLDAALALFEARGYDAVAVPEIARAADVATGTIYRYFETKDALVNALYLHWKTAYNEAVLAPLPEGRPRAIFSLYWRRMTAFARAHPRAMRFLDLHHHAAYLDARSRKAETVTHAAAQHFVAQARKAGAIRAVPAPMVVALLWGAAAGLIKFSQGGTLKFDARAAATMEDMLWRAIAREPANDGGKINGKRTKR